MSVEKRTLVSDDMIIVSVTVVAVGTVATIYLRGILNGHDHLGAL